MTATFCTPAFAYVSQYDTKYLSQKQQDRVDSATKAYDSAKAAEDTAGTDGSISSPTSVESNQQCLLTNAYAPKPREMMERVYRRECF